MADQKISELTALTGANVADDDAIAIVDTSATETKKIVFSELKNALDTATGFVRITGDTMTGNLSMGDNVKAIFGAGSDLQIYHDGSNSYVKDNGTGDLYLQGTANVRITNTSGQKMFLGQDGGEAQLYYSGVEKLATTSTGIDVTGAVTADSLTVDGVARLQGGAPYLYLDNSSNTGSSRIYFGDADSDITGYFLYDHSTNSLRTGVNGSERMRITSSGSVGIGTSSPSAELHIEKSSADAAVRLVRTGYGYTELIGSTGGSGNDFKINLNGTDRFYIQNSSGNVGIGTSSPSQKLEVSDTTTATVIVRVTNNDGNAEMQKHQEHLYINLNDTGNIFFRSGSTITERMRLDASGNLLVGTTLTSEVDESGTRIVVGDAGFIEHSRTSTTDTLPNVVLARGNDGEAIRFIRNDGSNREVGDIVLTTSATSYNTSSDHRLKENVVELTGATTRLKQLEPKRFNFIADADTTVDGFIAHEVQSVVPEAITGTHNEVDDDGNPVYQGIDQSKLVPLLVATIKELEARITALENA